MNLLKETIADLEEFGKTVEDIEWVGSKEVEIPLDTFLKLADKEYDSGYGAQEVATDLVICGKDWWMERHEYDGSEWWEMKTMPIRPGRVVRPLRVISDLWCSLKAMNHPEGKYSDTPWDWEGMEG